MSYTCVDSIKCGTVAELVAAIEEMGMALDLSHPVRVNLIEETFADGSKVERVQLFDVHEAV